MNDRPEVLCDPFLPAGWQPPRVVSLDEWRQRIEDHKAALHRLKEKLGRPEPPEAA